MRPYIRLWKQTLGGHKQNLVHTRTQNKGAVTPKETDPELPMSVQEYLVREKERDIHRDTICSQLPFQMHSITSPFQGKNEE